MSPSGFPTGEEEESSHVGFLSSPRLQLLPEENSVLNGDGYGRSVVVAATIREPAAAAAPSLFSRFLSYGGGTAAAQLWSSSCLPTCVEITNISHIWSTFTT